MSNNEILKSPSNDLPLPPPSFSPDLNVVNNAENSSTGTCDKLLRYHDVLYTVSVTRTIRGSSNSVFVFRVIKFIVIFTL